MYRTKSNTGRHDSGNLRRGLMQEESQSLIHINSKQTGRAQVIDLRTCPPSETNRYIDVAVVIEKIPVGRDWN